MKKLHEHDCLPQSEKEWKFTTLSCTIDKSDTRQYETFGHSVVVGEETILKEKQNSKNKWYGVGCNIEKEDKKGSRMSGHEGRFQKIYGVEKDPATSDFGTQ
jgi:hypothetical protein